MIPTAEEFARYYKLDKEGKSRNQDKSSYDMMVEFAKLHVQAALQAAANDAMCTEDTYMSIQEGSCAVIDKDSIVSAYPLTNIK